MNTGLPAIRIGERVGLRNAAYFFTLFKKQYQITPPNTGTSPGTDEEPSASIKRRSH